MAIYAIATIMKSDCAGNYINKHKNVYKNVCGVRLLDDKTLEVKDCSISSVMKNIREIKNLRRAGTIKTLLYTDYTDAVSALTAITRDGKSEEAIDRKFIVLGMYQDGSFKVCTYRGNIERVYCEEIGVGSEHAILEKELFKKYGRMPYINAKCSKPFMDLSANFGHEQESIMVSDESIPKLDKLKKVLRMTSGYFSMDDDYTLNVQDNKIYSLKEIIIPSGVVVLNCGLFQSKNSVGLCGYSWKAETLTFPDSVRCVQSHACTGVGFKNIVLNEGLEIIGRWAFSYCENIESIVIPSTVKLIGYGAFTQCKSLKKVIVRSKNTRIERGTLLNFIKHK